jgi:hypothetical protein
MTLSILLSFCFLAALCAMALLWSRWPRYLKAILVIGVSVFYFYGNAVLQDIWGFPSAEKLPERFVLLAAVIEEPSKSKAGALYIWVNAIESGKPTALPRAYALPYTKDLHSLLNDGMKKIRQGVSQVGSAEPKLGKRGVSWLRPGSDEQNIKIRDLPVPQLPEK